MTYLIGKGACLWFTGLSGAGKTTLVEQISSKLSQSDISNEILDGDVVRTHLSKGLGFSKEDRELNVGRIAWVASRIVKFGGIALVGCISPYERSRNEARKTVEAHGAFVEVFVNTSLEECERRDPKGLYKKVRNGEIQNFTGISDPYEIPKSADLTIVTEEKGIAPCRDLIIQFMEHQGILVPNVPRALYIGRWQPFHHGHFHIIQKSLDEGVPVAIGVRATPVSPGNPFPVHERVRLIQEVFAGEDVLVFPVPDIASVNIGRAVGYEVNLYEVPEEVESISATKIRALMKQGSSEWHQDVPERSIPVLESLVEYL